ncbi:uncharacterized protein CLUP02_00061 [Colletotrichum lupini]|uniref:Syndecan/Neurexin domain-containing protein n=1 Tax=Colletotrichum lupini TaxID=145971 RepID=A0A9Q8W8D5_9PEZI|nr:uncharacterized protein CLUP02_00061 [Colletotrichum lupini]KAK1718936.1 hypothetical protein BDP67DRAFT_503859 [Colletotrichum lupini]UQC73417.1 hypothetical protein CLUP02_00061 [Colletotrichum lupini]
MSRISAQLWLSLFLIGLGRAASIVYVTDLSIYTLLAPCVQTAVSYNIFSQTYSACGEAPTDLQSCICTKNNNLAAISTSIARSISYSCGSTASDDQTSAAAVISQYCNPDTTVNFPTPTTNIVTKYATDIAEFANMAPCAQSGVSYAISSMSTYCPEAASLMAPCICSKNDNSARVSRSIASLVRYSCSNAADVTSGLAFYDAYCAMNKGTTSFPQPSPPPGDMTYYMTALSQYSSLAACAQSGFSDAIYSLTRYQCPTGPQALASCMCLKDGVTNIVMSTVTSDIKWYCSSTATDVVSSAVAVLDYYCKAARNEVVATVAESIAQTYPTAQAGTGSGTSGAEATATATGSSGTSGDGTNTNGKSKSSIPSLAAIIGGVIAVVGALSIAALIAFIIYRRRKKNEAGFPLPGAAGPPEMAGKPELGGTMLSELPPKSPQMSVSYTTGSPHPDTISPASNASGVWAQSPPGVELHGQTRLPSEMPANTNGQLQPAGQYLPSELQGQHGQPAYPQQQPYGQSLPLPPELQNSYNQPHVQNTLAEAHGQPIHQSPSGPSAVYQGQGRDRAELQGMGWHAGPTPGYSEMDGGQQRQQ